MSDSNKINVPDFLKTLDRLFASENLEKAEQLLESTLEKARSLGDWSAEISILSEMMGFYRRNNKADKGLKAVQDGLALIEKHSLKSSVSGATVMLNAATTLKAFGKAAEGIPVFKAAERTFNDKLDPNDYRFAGLYNNMALSYVDTDDLKSAEEYYLRALSILSTCENGECEMAVTYCNMAYMYHKADPEDERINKVMSRAEECLESQKVARDGYYAFTASKCYSAFEYFGFFVYADKLKKISEKIYESNR
ncbi:MAG: tetratricopeptide repeat protein [Clostridia bacterium]|nr:tetratricopeptide repeat protein [Clostridia bacterium]